MGKTLRQWKEDEAIRSLPILAGGSDSDIEPAVATAILPGVPCSLIGDVTGNNFTGNWMCLNIGMQIGNPSQYGGRAFDGSTVRMFGGFGVPPPGSYPPPGTGGPMSATFPFAKGDFYLQADTGSIYWFTGAAWQKTSTL